MVVSLFFGFGFVLFYLFVCLFVYLFLSVLPVWQDGQRGSSGWELLISQDCGGKGERLSRSGQGPCNPFSLGFPSGWPGAELGPVP